MISSGIYKMYFSDGSFYIGKSVDIDKRWAQHDKAFSKGTHTKKLQSAYNRLGYPDYEVLFECHPDHIDILETFFINKYWGPNILNSTKPAEISEEGLDILRKFPREVWTFSTFEHLNRWADAVEESEDLKKLVDKKESTKIIRGLEEKLEQAEADLHQLRSRNFFSRVFNKQ